MRPAAAVTRKDNGSAVGRKARFGVNPGRTRNSGRIRSVGRINDVNLRQTVTSQRHRKLAAVGRPAGCAVVALEVGDGSAGAGSQCVHVDDRLAGLEAHIGELRAIGRPGRRDDRLARTQGDLRILAVGIGDLQFVGGAFLQHIRNTGREHAANAGDLFVDAVSDLVGDAAQFLLRAGKCHAVQLRLLDRIGQAVANVVAAVGPTGDAAVGDEVGALATPVVVGNGGIDVQAGAGGVDQAELARAGQVGADHFGQRAAVGVIDGEISDGHRILGCPGAGNIDA
ncbi:hypothetical protein D3C85_876050 [compost metagenome]